MELSFSGNLKGASGISQKIIDGFSAGICFLRFNNVASQNCAPRQPECCQLAVSPLCNALRGHRNEERFRDLSKL